MFTFCFTCQHQKDKRIKTARLEWFLVCPLQTTYKLSVETHFVSSVQNLNCLPDKSKPKSKHDVIWACSKIQSDGTRARVRSVLQNFQNFITRFAFGSPVSFSFFKGQIKPLYLCILVFGIKTTDQLLIQYASNYKVGRAWIKVLWIGQKIFFCPVLECLDSMLVPGFIIDAIIQLVHYVFTTD